MDINETISNMHKKLAATYENAGDMERAIDYYKRLVKHYEKQNDDLNCRYYCIKIADLSENIKKMGEAHEFYKRALEFQEKIK